MDRILRSCLLGAALAAASPAAAGGDWYTGEYEQCSQATSTLEIVECVAEQMRAWDQRLNAAYREVMAIQPPPRREELRDAQRKWIAYRDANCGFYARGEGTIARIEAAECLRVLTMHRTLELETMLTQ